jgi:hypothetical protein
LIRLFKKFSLFVVTILLGCSAESDSSSPGLCSLQCGGSKIAGSEVVLRLADKGVALGGEGNAPNSTLGSAEAERSCAGVVYNGANGIGEYHGPISISFVAEKFRKLVYRNPYSSNTQENANPGEFRQPIRGVAFEPIIVGGLLSADRSDPENITRDANNLLTPYKYVGIVTPKAEWCTDSCGVGVVEIWPLCVRGKTNTVTMAIHSGTAFTQPILIPIADTAEEE